MTNYPATPLRIVHRFLVWILILLAVRSAALAASDVDALRAEVAGKGWIVYGARTPSGDWDLFICRPDGSDVRPLTRTPGHSEFAPQFSADGRKLLYRRLPRGDSIDGNRYGEQGEPVVAASDGSNSQSLGPAGSLPWASWSPDGSHVATLSIKGASFVDVSTGRVERTLPRQGFFQQLTWSPDGKWLLGVANSYGTGWSIARMNAATGETNAVNRVDCCTPDWFPDSRQVIFSWRPPGQKVNNGYGWTRLWMADADGKIRRLVYGEDGRHVYGGHVSPDGKYVLFTGNVEENGDPEHAGAPMGLVRLSDTPIIRGESRELRAEHPQTHDGPVLTLPVGLEPCWTFSELPGGSAASKPAPAAEGASALRDELRGRGWLAFSAKTDAGDWDLFLIRPDGSGRQHLTDTREFNEGGVRFSPDGARLFYYRMPKSEPLDNNTYGTFELVVANADGSAAEVYGKAFPWASWGADGKQLASLTPKGIQIVDVATRQVVRRYPRRGMVSQLGWSPDGKRFVGTTNGLGPYWNIGLLDAAADKITALSETQRYNCTPDWCPDGQQVVYARGIIPEQPGRAELWAVRLDGSQRRRLYAEEGLNIYGACASPDGKYLAFTRSVEDLGSVPEIEMAIIRWPASPQSGPMHPAERLDLGPGWEPHWTFKEVVK